MKGALFNSEQLNYCFLNQRDAKPIIPNAKIARVDGSGIALIVLVSASMNVIL
ncbi:hypothetical protein MT391_00155 [Vibrio sp. 1-Bac 57]